MLQDENQQRRHETESWSSWASPVGLGIFMMCLGVFLASLGAMVALLGSAANL